MHLPPQFLILVSLHSLSVKPLEQNLIAIEATNVVIILINVLFPFVNN